MSNIGTITINNIRNTRYGIYIGRANRRWGLEASPLANPNSIQDVPDPITNLSKYAHLLLKAMKDQGETKEEIAKYKAIKSEITRLKDMVLTGQSIALLCWCVKAPSLRRSDCPDTPCHGFVVKGAIEWMIKQAQAK